MGAYVRALCMKEHTLTSTGVLVADPSILAWVVFAGSRPTAALVDSKHSPPALAPPLRRITHCDWLPVELQVLQATAESAIAEEQESAGAHQAARRPQVGHGVWLVVQGKLQGCGAHLQEDVVPAAVGHRRRGQSQAGGRQDATAEGEVKMAATHLRTEEHGQSVFDTIPEAWQTPNMGSRIT